MINLKIKIKKRWWPLVLIVVIKCKKLDHLGIWEAIGWKWETHLRLGSNLIPKYWTFSQIFKKISGKYYNFLWVNIIHLLLSGVTSRKNF